MALRRMLRWTIWSFESSNLWKTVKSVCEIDFGIFVSATENEDHGEDPQSGLSNHMLLHIYWATLAVIQHKVWMDKSGNQSDNPINLKDNTTGAVPGSLIFFCLLNQVVLWVFYPILLLQFNEVKRIFFFFFQLCMIPGEAIAIIQCSQLTTLTPEEVVCLYFGSMQIF